MLLIGIDEAGYGPSLGPLCHGLAAFRVADTDPVPDLWAELKPVVTRAAGRSTALQVDDSKRIYSGSDKLNRLRRGVQAFGTCVTGVNHLPLPAALLSVEDLAGVESDPWGCLLAEAPSDPAIDPAVVRDLQVKLAECRIEPVILKAGALDARRFNARLNALDNKADVTWERVGSLLCEALRSAHPGETVQVVVDRQGGRKFYAGHLSVLFGVALPEVETETAERSAYRVILDGRRVLVEFTEKAERAAFAVALASMAAKLVRELLMARFNAFFVAHDPNLAPTAGYPTDAVRFLRETKELRQRLGVSDASLIRQK